MRRATGWFAAAAAWTLFIFLTLTYTPHLITWCSNTLNKTLGIDYGYALIGHAAATILGIAMLILLVKLSSNPAVRSAERIAGVLCVSGIYGYFVSIMHVPTEKIHFIEYGVLSYLLYRGWRELIPTSAVWGAVFFTGSLIGIADEYTQHLLPNRHGELVDIVWNCTSIGLPLFVFRLFETVPRRRSGEGIMAVRITALFAFGALAAFILTVQEFGILIDDPRGYNFKTRLASPEAFLELPVIPSEARESLKSPFLYGQFLRDFPAALFPRLYEFRVHLFRRDRYLAVGLHDVLKLSVIGQDTEHFRSFVESDSEIMRAFRDYALQDGSVKSEIDTLYGEYADSFARLTRWAAGADSNFGEAAWKIFFDEVMRKSAGDAPNAHETMKNFWIAERENSIMEDYFGAELDMTGSRWNPASVELMHRNIWRRESEPYFSAVADRVVTGHSFTSIAVVFALLFLTAFFAPRLFAEPTAAKLVLYAAFLFAVVRLYPSLFSPPIQPSDKVLEMSIPVHRIGMLYDPAVIDGRPDVPLEPKLRGANGDTSGPAAAFDIRIAGENLYVAAACRDTSILAPFANRDSDIWRGDAIEIFIDTVGDGRTYIEIEIAPNGAIYDALVHYAHPIDFASSTRWNCEGVHAAAVHDSEGWSVEALIPLTSLGGGAAMARRGMRVNVTRIDAAPGSRFTFHAWSPTYGWFHRPWRFGIVSII